MHKFFSFACVVFVALLVSTSGCKRDYSRPDDLPKLNPCRIKVIQGGQPLSRALVTLRSENTEVKYKTSTGTTNSEGVAEMRTYSYPGVPVGAYKMTVVKSGHENSEGEMCFEGGVSKGDKEYSFVDPKFSKMKETPLAMEVTSGSNYMEVDVGDEVQTFIGLAP